MAQPQAYNRETDFTERDGDDTNHAGINTELDAAALSINEIRDNLALIQRDDGGLQNGIVTAESLAPSAFDAVLVEVNLAVTDAQTAAASANNAAVSANTARDEAVAAKDTAVTSASAAALNATTATTKATEAAASATASATSATNSATSATSSANSATTATTKAAEASTSATNAAASASAAATSQTAAATSATNAATSATTATTQATTATTQATNAAASAAAAAASFDQFEDLYLGSKTTDPTTDNDGNPLLSGALYFNSVAGEMRVWADTFWKSTGSSVGGTINTAKYTATAGQTTFAIVYDVGFVHVYQNGVKLESGVDFTANNGTSVVLTTGAVAGDVVDMIAFGIFSVANTYMKAEADALLAGKLATSDGAVGTSNLANSAVTYAKMQNVAAGKVLGRDTSGSGVVQELPIQIDSSGRVGLGAASSAARFHIEDGTEASIRLVSNGSGGDQGAIYVQKNSGGGLVIADENRDIIFKRGAGALTANGGTESARIDTSGRFTIPYQPSCSVHPAASTPIGTGTILFSQIRFNVGSHYNAATGRFTAPVAGKYQFNLTAQHWGGTSTAGFIDVVRNNGDINARFEVNGGAGYQAGGISGVIDMIAGDFLSVAVSGNIWHDDGTNFSVILIG